MSNRNYTEATRDALFALSTGCYYPECKQASVKIFGDDPGKFVDIAHIHAEKPGGPRHIKLSPGDDYDDFKNLILLCKRHHNKVDKVANLHLYPAEELKKWKRIAEKDIRTKFDGLDNLTEERLEKMLDNAAKSTMTELDNAIDSLRDHVSAGASEIIRLMLDKVEKHYLDEELVHTLNAASHRLASLEGEVSTLWRASVNLEHLEGSASKLDNAVGRASNLPLNEMPNWLDDFRSEYNSIVNSMPDLSGVALSVEYAGQRVIDQIEARAASINLGEPPIVYDHPQRWRFFGAGVICAVVAGVVGVILALNYLKPS